VNEGGGMDPKSGIFAAPVSGAYCISFHVNTLDLFLHKNLAITYLGVLF
jgi:hypothetical protein